MNQFVSGFPSGADDLDHGPCGAMVQLIIPGLFVIGRNNSAELFRTSLRARVLPINGARVLLCYSADGGSRAGHESKRWVHSRNRFPLSLESERRGLVLRGRESHSELYRVRQEVAQLSNCFEMLYGRVLY